VRVALTISGVGVEGDMLDEFLRFHRAAGADVVVVGATASWHADKLERYERDGFVRRVGPDASPTDLARIAVDELGADWLIPTTPDEFWWPRGESLTDVLAVIPPRYGVVQGLVRTFVGSSEASGPAAIFESVTVRKSLLGPDGSGGAPLGDLLRPVYRAGPSMTLDADDWTLGGRRVPLRAWYPIEVFRYDSDEALDRSRIDVGLADASLAVDTRLRDALASAVLAFPVPSIVDDASYAVECAAVGEVDLVRLDRQIRELELRIAALEAGFWPTAKRVLRRIARRPS
jgi:hypothetical protein